MMGLANGQDVQKIANNLSVGKTISAEQTQLPIPFVKDATVKLLGVDYEEIISEDGAIRPVLSPTRVAVSFEVSKGNTKAISKDYFIEVMPAKPIPTGVNAKPSVIPELLQWRGGKGEFSFVDAKNAVQIVGASPELLKEIKAIVPQGLNLSKTGTAKLSLKVTPKATATLGDEGYTMKITPTAIAIEAGTEKGLYWGTRSLLQILKLNKGKVPCGEVVDFPRFKIRGFMFDAARTPFTMSSLEEIVDTMSWYKMNDFHINLNNNYIFHENYVDAGKDPFKESYAGYRLESDYKNAKGETLHSQDLHYSKKEFVQFIQDSAKQGVAIVPEINSPAHALSFTRMRPDLIYKGPMNNEKRRCEMLDASRPETLEFVSSILDEYLLPDKKTGKAVFEGLTFHVGSDEFYGTPESYRKYTDSILKYVKKRGYQPRVWGSLNKKQGPIPVLAEGVQLNLWNGGWAKAWDSINQGFDIINTDDGALYIVPFADYYRMDKNQKWVYEHFKPNHVASDTVPSGHPQFLGATFAVWNDMIDIKHPGYHFRDIAESINSSIAIVAQKTWSDEVVPRSYDAHRALVPQLGYFPVAPKKLEKAINLKDVKAPTALNGAFVNPNYHLTAEIEINPSAAGKQQILLSDGKAAFMPVMADGRVGFRRDDTLSFAYDYKLPLGKRVKVELIGTLGKTQLWVDGKLVGDKPVLTTFKSTHKEKISTFPLPLKTIGAKWDGKIYSIQVTQKP